MKPYKILYLNQVAYMGGAEIALLDLLTYIDRTRYSPVVLVPEGNLMDELRRSNVPCEPIPVLPGLNRYTLPRFLARLPRLISSVKRHRPDLIHANTNFTSLYSGIISKAIGIPTIGQIRDIEPLGRMGRILVRQNTGIIAISLAVKHYLMREHVPEEQIKHVYDGVDLNRYHPHIETCSPTNNMIIIGIVGQIGQRKGHVYLLEAAKSLVPVHHNLLFRIIGKEPLHSKEKYTELLHQYVKESHLEQYVKFLGFQSDIPGLLAQIDILVLPSLQEPFGKIVIEAMAMCKPVVASKVGGVPEIVVDGKTGILVPPKDSVAIQKALEQLITDPEKRKQMGVAGRERVEQHFSIKKTVRKTEQVYEEILDFRF